MRSGLTEPRYTGDGYVSPTRKSSRRPLPRRQTGMPSQVTATEMTESSFDDDSRPPQASDAKHPVPVVSGTGKLPRARSSSRHDTEPLSPISPQEPPLIPRPEVESSILSDPRPKRRDSSRRRSVGDKAGKAAQARAASLAAEQDRDRQRYGSPHSQSVSLKLKVHDDKDRNVTLRRLTEEEARTARGNRSRSRADSESDLSGIDPPGYTRTRYRRDSSQRRAESEAERRTEAAATEPEVSDLGPLSPPNPAFAKGRRNAGKDSAYYSGGAAGQPGPAGTSIAAGQTVSSLGSQESHGTWSQMSGSQTNPGRAPTVGSAADTRRQRRRMERRRGSSSRPSGADMFE
uniref:Uncharacterized protein n=1 Tax=Bionectria ochroleuca TaxID=29856 RepID=A0A8H7N515_BIOOC